MIALFSIPAHADRVIVTPAPSSLAPGQYSGEALFGVDRHQARNAQWLSGTAGMMEVEASHFYLPRRQASALSLGAAIFPETNVSPSLAVGVRDLLGTARHFGEYGYSGPNLYLAAGKTLPGANKLSFPLRNLSLTAGVGTGVERAVFGSASADLALGFRQTLEFDGRGLNYRLGYPLASGIARLEYDRLHGRNLVGLSLTSPVRL